MLGAEDENGETVPPHNIEIEQALLGGILVNNHVAEEVEGLVGPEDFYDPFHGQILEIINQLMARGSPASPITIRDYLDEQGIEELGRSVTEYLADLAASATAPLFCTRYAEMIRDYAQRRKLVEIAAQIRDATVSGDAGLTARHQIEAAEEALFKISGDTGRAGPRQINAVTADFLSDLDDIRSGRALGVPTGLLDLDKILGGLFAPDLIIIAGRPGMGKSAIAVNIIRHIAENSGWAVLFSIEMAGRQIVERLIADGANVPVDAMRRGGVDETQMQSVSGEALRVAGLNIIIDDAAKTVAEIRTRSRRLHRKYGLRVIVIDYLQLMVGGGSGENRTQEIAIITAALKGIAKDLGVPVIALSQLNRGVENRDNKRPMLADLRDGGTIEQDADLVMFLYREAYYMERDEPPDKGLAHTEWLADMDGIRNTAELIIAKNRFGPTGKVLLSFIPERTRFGNLAREDR